ncbi:alpha-tocopherol transfer protein-like [Nephila pilipes]|uniref:Alpha-tocopherol transfer protein-like n=1 Tax=Nephila pilipes TaxID=299642 RepID=A0A8X6UBD7_NEPPI|nr:alpha-tocopherol transfer protein-like [Nephila pilipes]
MSSNSSKLIQESNEIFPFEMKHLPDFVLKKLEEELKETPEKKQKSLLELKKLLDADEQLTYGIDFHEDFLTQYLRHSKYDTQRAFYHLRSMLLLRKKYSTLFDGIPDEFFLTKDSPKCIRLLPKRCPEGCTIVIYQYGKYNPKELSVEDFKKMIVMLDFQMLRDPMTQINGFKFIHDFQGTTMQHLKLCTPSNMYLFYHAGIHCIPARYKEIHIINEPYWFKPCWIFIKSFLSEKVRNRVYFHSSTEKLFDHFPRAILPTEYGGDLRESYLEDWLRKANTDLKKHGVTGQPNYF